MNCVYQDFIKRKNEEYLLKINKGEESTSELNVCLSFKNYVYMYLINLLITRHKTFKMFFQNAVILTLQQNKQVLVFHFYQNTLVYNAVNFNSVICLINLISISLSIYQEVIFKVNIVTS